MKITKSTGNVFEDLGFKKETAANLRIRAELIIQLREYIKRHNLSQKETARMLGISQPDVSAINTGKISKFSIDKLINLLTLAGHEVAITSDKYGRVFSIIEDGKRDEREDGVDHSNNDLMEA